MADNLSDYEALRDRLRECRNHPAADAIDALLAERADLRRRLELESQTLRDTMVSYERLDQEHEALEGQVRALTRERESDYAQALAHRKGLTAKLDMAEAELARLRAAVEFACKQRCAPFLDYGRHAPECLAYELQPDEQARSAALPGAEGERGE